MKLLVIMTLFILLSFSSFAQKSPCKIKMKDHHRSHFEWYPKSTIKLLASKGYDLLDKKVEFNDDEADYIIFLSLSSSGYPKRYGKHIRFELTNSHTKEILANARVNSNKKQKGNEDVWGPLMKKMELKMNRKIARKLKNCPL